MNLPLIPPVKNESLNGDVLSMACDCLVVGIGESGNLSPIASLIDERTSGWLTNAIASGAAKTKRGELLTLPTLPGIGQTGSCAAVLMFVGTGDLAQLDRGKAFDLASTVMRRLVDSPRNHIVFSLGTPCSPEVQEAFVAGAIAGCAGQSNYFSDPAIHPPASIGWHDFSPSAVALGTMIGDSINVTRRLVNEPPNVLYPESFADAAAAVGNEVGLSVEIWDETRLDAEGCRAILAVGAASIRPPRLVILRHYGAPSTQAPVALVGKGVTFDSGGLSIKPTDGMTDMKCDMAGAATVLGAMRTIALMKLPINVVGLCGLAENMISGASYKLGDVIESRQGTTIEILNTDAEGRVVLADVLDVAVQNKPSAIVDLATLTGACMVGLGRDVVGLMTNSESLCSEIIAAAKQESEPVWQLPMFEMYGEHIKSKVADIKNTGDARWGGAITAAKFLERFVDDVPWVHMDIAGPAFAESPKPHRDAGATGVMLRTLVSWLKIRAAS